MTDNGVIQVHEQTTMLKKDTYTKEEKQKKPSLPWEHGITLKEKKK